ncbi:exodeoxyribonuclease VII small subunit [Sporosalibacterium faouarense]|uniref:exodeoxyribonuclease VII small subunit n=1 Tax=Sporosalibacterium faouarense TaxID=516123 RepID=UPI00141CF3DE|nr:exodeoxyribonuclease VII small subunit [Sporosalibacterium faouarense]MTI48192.1 exodeoxyribonuclease VII small subunit [Bacillota bacterium]
MKNEKEKLSFEDAIEKLEGIIAKLEEGDLSLDQSLEEFQKGIELYRHCSNVLVDVDGKIKVILDNGADTPEEVDFEEDL